jgi:polyhydroxybutyrate depolymerase
MSARFVLSMAALLVCGDAALADGQIRERIRDQWLKRQEARPAPQASADTQVTLDKPGTYTFQIPQNEYTRYYTLHVPKRYRPGVAAPLLFVLHGGGGDMKIQATDAFYKQISKAEAEGFIAVFPNGSSSFPSGKLATWNAGRCCGLARDRNVDDVGFIKDILKKISQQLTMDKTRIFATGMSNGGMMAYRLACEMPETFRAVAAVAGTDNTVQCHPAIPISILHIHAKDDDHVLFNGGAGPGSRDKSTVTEFTSVPETRDKWIKLNGCAPTPKRVLERKGASCERYTGCRNDVAVQICVTESGGHSWPGGKKPRMFARGQPSTALSANDVMWDFFNGK